MGAMMTIGEVGPHDDAGYSGETGESQFSVQYYRNKAIEFQTILNAIDQGARAAESMLASGAISDADGEALLAYLNDFDSRKGTLRLTAEAINAGAAAWNSLGGRFPSLSIPGGLGALPVIPLALIAAIGTAAVLIDWGRQWLQGLNTRMQQAALLESIDDPETRAQVAAAAMQAASAASAAESSPLSSIAGAVKWGAIALAAFLAYRAFAAMRDD